MGSIRRIDDGESWRDCAVRYGKKEGIGKECGQAYDAFIEDGRVPAIAAVFACTALEVADDFEPREEGVERGDL